MNKTVKDLQNQILVILEEIDKKCSLYNIKYFLCGGSCLGAIRHNGFIPWDDDADILMEQEQYEKFYNLCLNSNILDSKFFFQCPETEFNYYESFIRVRLKNTKCVIDYHKERGYKELGVFVDIFPCNYSYTNNLSAISKYVHKCELIRKIYISKISRRKTFKNRLICILLFFLSARNVGRLLKRAEKSLDKPNQRIYIIDPYCKYGFKHGIFPIDTSTNLIRHQFQNLSLLVPFNFDLYLKTMYGDNYMTLPPESDRVAHLPKELEF